MLTPDSIVQPGQRLLCKDRSGYPFLTTGKIYTTLSGCPSNGGTFILDDEGLPRNTYILAVAKFALAGKSIKRNLPAWF